MAWGRLWRHRVQAYPRSVLVARRFRVLSWSYTATVIMVTVVVMQVYGVWNQRVGAFQERATRRAVADSMLGVMLLEHADSIIHAVALQTSYVFLYRRDSILRARRAECGPLKEAC